MGRARTLFPATVPAGEKVVSWGGGVNSTAALVLLHAMGEIPRAILMADPGHEWPETHAYRLEVLKPWLESVGFPELVLVTRREEAQNRKRCRPWTLTETLGDACERMRSLPSVAYPPSKKCSLKFKAQPQNWWLDRQDWTHAEWEAGRKIVKVIGYDAGEDRRARPSFGDPWEHARFVPWYPLLEEDIDRDGCMELIREHGLPVPRKSACTFCPNNTAADWLDLRRDHPDLFTYAVEMSRRATATVLNPDVVGLLRCNRKGTRQLHDFVDGAVTLAGTEFSEMPCECAL